MEATFSELINPEKPLSPKIRRLTGIANEELAVARLASEVLPDFFSFIGDLPLVAQNAEFDVRMINMELRRCHARTSLHFGYDDDADTLSMARERYPEWPAHTLEAICANLNICNDGAHRALNDVHATMKCYELLKNTPIPEPTFYRRRPPKEVVEASKPHFEFTPGADLAGQAFCITGDLETLERETAEAFIVKCNGVVKSGVSGKLNYLVNGFAGSGYVSTKLAAAQILIGKGKPILIITEQEFLDMIGVKRVDG